jgi:hypothetical protein
MGEKINYWVSNNAVLFFNCNTHEIAGIPEKEIILNDVWKMIIDEYFSYIKDENELNDNVLSYEFYCQHKNNDSLSELFAIVNEIPIMKLFESLGCDVIVEDKCRDINVKHNNLLLKIKPNNYKVIQFLPEHTIDCSKLFELFLIGLTKHEFKRDVIKVIADSGIILSKLIATFYKRYFNELFNGSGIRFSNSQDLLNEQ